MWHDQLPGAPYRGVLLADEPRVGMHRDDSGRVRSTRTGHVVRGRDVLCQRGVRGGAGAERIREFPVMTCPSCQQTRPDAADIRRARALLCQVCIYAEHDSGGPWDGQAVTCTISGKPVTAHIMSCAPSCPKGKHPDKDGIVKFAWVKWYGVPRFLRWLLAGRLTGSVPGCGCCKWAKDKWLRLTGRTMVKGF